MSLSSARSPRRGFVWALVASLLLHAATLGWSPVELGRDASGFVPAARSTIAVRLLPPPAVAAMTNVAPPTASSPPPASAAASRPPALRAGVATVSATRVPSPPPASEAVLSTAVAMAPPVSDTTANMTADPAADPAPDPSAPAAKAAAPATVENVGATGRASVNDGAGAGGPAVAEFAPAGPPVASDPLAPSPAADPAHAAAGSIRFPRNGRLEYAVTVGDPPTPIGRAIYAWEANEHAYRLSLTAETTGLVGLFRRVRIVQLSEGSITPDGLRPDSFQMDRGPKGRNEFARFDWTARQLTYGYPDAVQSGTLAEGTQDMLSLILQFAFVPIVEGRRDVAITSGRKLYMQSYERVTEEAIETPYGAWRAWHLRRVRASPGDEGYDLWLATDQPFLPVRIRWTDRRGRVTSATLDTVRLARD